MVEKTTKRPPVYQLPPNKPAFVPTAEPWSKSVYGDIEGNATNDNNIMIDGGNSSLKNKNKSFMASRGRIRVWCKKVKYTRIIYAYTGNACTIFVYIHICV